MGLKESALKGFAWTLTQQVSVQSINFIVQLVLARILLPEHFGTIAVIQIFLSISQTLIDSGMTTSLIRNKDMDNRDYSTVFYMNLAFSVTMYAILYLFSPVISIIFNNSEITDVLRVLSIVLILQSFTNVQRTRLTKEMNFRLQMMLQLPSVLIAGILGVVLALNGLGVWSLVYMQIARFLVLTLSYMYRIRWVPEPNFSVSRFKYHFSFGYKLALSNLFTTTYNNMYSFIVGSMFSTRQLGLYTQANNLARFPVNNLTSALLKVTFPLFSKTSNDEQLKEAFKKITQSVLIIVAPCMFLLVVIAEPLFEIVLTDKWDESVPFFQFLCCFFILHPVNGYNINVLLVKGRSDLHLKSEVIKKSIGVFFFLLVIPFGIWGVLYSQAVGMILGVLINSYYCSQIIGYSLYEQIQDVFSIIVVSLVPMLVVLLLDGVLNELALALYLELIIISVLYVLLFMLSIKLFKIEALSQLVATIRPFLKR